MPILSARQLLGLTVAGDASDTVLGVVENVTINPQLMVVDGLLVGQAGGAQTQRYWPRECLKTTHEHAINVTGTATDLPSETRRIFGLSAWTHDPKFLVGFVYNFHFDLISGMIESFTIHQLIRTWRIPATAVEKITPTALIITTDTSVKLKLTPYTQ